MTVAVWLSCDCSVYKCWRRYLAPDGMDRPRHRVTFRSACVGAVGHGQRVVHAERPDTRQQWRLDLGGDCVGFGDFVDLDGAKDDGEQNGTSGS